MTRWKMENGKWNMTEGVAGDSRRRRLQSGHPPRNEGREPCLDTLTSTLNVKRSVGRPSAFRRTRLSRHGPPGPAGLLERKPIFKNFQYFVRGVPLIRAESR